MLVLADERQPHRGLTTVGNPKGDVDRHLIVHNGPAAGFTSDKIVGSTGWLKCVLKRITVRMMACHHYSNSAPDAGRTSCLKYFQFLDDADEVPCGVVHKLLADLFRSIITGRGFPDADLQLSCVHRLFEHSAVSHVFG